MSSRVYQNTIILYNSDKSNRFYGIQSNISTVRWRRIVVDPLHSQKSPDVRDRFIWDIFFPAQGGEIGYKIDLLTREQKPRRA